MIDTSIPEALAPGLDLFAASWMHQWVEAGGSVQLSRDGKASLGFPVYHDSPAYIEPAADLPDAVKTNQETFRDAHYHGKMRGMLVVIEALPFGYDALKHHMRAHGMTCYFGKVGGGS